MLLTLLFTPPKGKEVYGDTRLHSLLKIQVFTIFLTLSCYSVMNRGNLYGFPI